MPQRLALDIMSFLEHYQLQPCLWNRNHPDYKNRPKREAAEAALLPISGLSSVRELRQKIRNIRCTYNQELAKIRRSVNYGASEIYKPKLIWFSFADSFLRANHDFTNDQSLIKVESFYSSHMGMNGNFPSMKEEPSNEMDYPMSDQESVGSSSNKIQAYEKHPSSTPNHYGSLAEFAETVETSPQVANNNNSVCSTNEFVVFGQHVAAQLQQLPLDEAIKLEEEIQSLITRARLRSMQSV